MQETFYHAERSLVREYIFVNWGRDSGAQQLYTERCRGVKHDVVQHLKCTNSFNVNVVNVARTAPAPSFSLQRDDINVKHSPSWTLSWYPWRSTYRRSRSSSGFHLVGSSAWRRLRSGRQVGSSQSAHSSDRYCRASLKTNVPVSLIHTHDYYRKNIVWTITLHVVGGLVGVNSSHDRHVGDLPGLEKRPWIGREKHFLFQVSLDRGEERHKTAVHRVLQLRSQRDCRCTLRH